tara:strand:- start:172 stop:504 length:333 start_codon:yes stop_codon:yes gene_type:complete
MIDTDKYEGHTGPWKLNKPVENGDYTIQDEMGTYRGKFYSRFRVEDVRLMADAPLLLQEVKWLREDINQIRIDLLESLDLILEAHHPEVRESVMAMLGDAIGNNVVGYEE